MSEYEKLHPGVFLRDELAIREWSQVEFAEIIMRPVGLVNRIINGKTGISIRTAQEISAALDMNAHYWLGLENAYRLWKTPPASPDIARRAEKATARNTHPEGLRGK